MEGTRWLGRVGPDRIPLGTGDMVVADGVCPKGQHWHSPSQVAATTTTSLCTGLWTLPGLSSRTRVSEVEAGFLYFIEE